jgi:hypothetical protein
VANVQYHEGGSLIPNKSPGRLTFSDVTLERGATSDQELSRVHAQADRDFTKLATFTRR